MSDKYNCEFGEFYRQIDKEKEKVKALEKDNAIWQEKFGELLKSYEDYQKVKKENAALNQQVKELKERLNIVNSILSTYAPKIKKEGKEAGK